MNAIASIRRTGASVLPHLPASVRYFIRTHFGKPSRYRNLLKNIRINRSASILEIGVYRGTRSVEMIQTAQMAHPTADVRYYGFDLFERLDADLLKSEFSKMPPPRQEVQELLETTGARIKLYEGFSQDTLPRFIEEWKTEGSPSVDFVFIDGGHAEETIRSDWENVTKFMGPETVVIFDDYYVEDYSAHIGAAGCQRIVDTLDRSTYDIEVLEPENAFPREWGTIRIKLAKVRLKRA